MGPRPRVCACGGWLAGTWPDDPLVPSLPSVPVCLGVQANTQSKGEMRQDNCLWMPYIAVVPERVGMLNSC